MLQCKQCAADLSNRTDIQSGISKKSGKPWRGVKCLCGNMEFLPYGYGQKPAVQNVLAPKIQQSPLEIKSGPGVDAKIEMINLQIRKNFEELFNRLKALENTLSDIDQKIIANHEAIKEAEEAMKPEDMQWSE